MASNTPQRGLAALVLCLGVAGANLCVSLTGGSEGKRNDPYADHVGAKIVATVCYGETHVEMRHYTDAECRNQLATTLADVYAQVSREVPGFDQMTVGQRVALVDYTYNRGIGNVKKVSGPNDPPNVLALYRTRDAGMCDAFSKWGVVKRGGAWVDCSVKSNQCYGIYARRIQEREMCKEGA